MNMTFNSLRQQVNKTAILRRNNIWQSLSHTYFSSRVQSVTKDTSKDLLVGKSVLPSTATRTLDHWMKSFENFVGITMVKEAQSLVLKEESKFLSVQQSRREKQQELSSIQSRLKSLNVELDKIPRTDDRYLQLLTEEHSIIKDEKALCDEVQHLEFLEREQFSILSSALRDSHDKERRQSERTKYWSIGGSCLGAIIGIIGTTINNHRRLSQLKQLVQAGQVESTNNIVDKLDTVSHFLTQLNNVLTSPGPPHLTDGGNSNSNCSCGETTLNTHKDLSEHIETLEKKLTLSIVGSVVSAITFFIIYSSFR